MEHEEGIETITAGVAAIASKGAEEEVTETCTPNEYLLDAARYGEVDDIRLAMANGCDLNFASEGGSNTALHMSSANGHLECVKVLVDAGALLLPNSTGNTPLHWAVLNNHAPVVKYLLDHIPTADVMLKNSFGSSALDEAFKRADGDMLLEVLKHKSAAGVESKMGMTEEDGGAEAEP